MDVLDDEHGELPAAQRFDVALPRVRQRPRTYSGSAVMIAEPGTEKPIVHAIASKTSPWPSSTTEATAARSFSNAASTGSVSRISASVFAASASDQ